MTSRRATVALVVAALAAPRSLRAAEQGRPLPRRVALLSPLAENDAEMKLRIEALLRGLRELGWVEGQALRLEVRYAAGSDDVLRRHCRELAASAPDLIVVVSNQAL